MNKQDDQKKYWYSIETYIHIAVKKEELLLYNPLNGEILEYTRQNHQPVFNLVSRLLSPKNLLVVPLSRKELVLPVVAAFIADTRRLFMGELIETSFSSGKPVQMMPVLAIKKDAQKLKHDPDRSASEEAMKFLNHISIYLNGACPQNCGICGNGYRQFLCCAKSRHELSFEALDELLRELSGSTIRRLDILGGDIFSHSRYEAMMEIILRNPAVKTFHVHYLNLANVIEAKRDSLLLSLSSPSSRLKLMVTFPLDHSKLDSCIETAKRHGNSIEVSFVIQSEKEFAEAEAAIERFGISNSAYQPYFNGENLEFFKENIYSLKEEILESRPQPREIYGNQKINRINFGSLTVTSDRCVYANVNTKRLGRIGTDSVFTMAGKELENGKNWLNIRSQVTPCKSCTFCALCPPINNFSAAIGRYDLCFKTM